MFYLQQQEQDPTNLYISNLPLPVDEKELENMLQPFGQVVSTRILRDYSGNSRGVGFARSVSEVTQNELVALFCDIYLVTSERVVLRDNLSEANVIKSQHKWGYVLK